MHMKKQIALLVALVQLSLLTIARAETSALVLGPNTLPAFVTGQPFLISLTATGGVPPYAWSPLALPPGFQLNAAASTITGTPTTAGKFILFVKATDALGTNVNRGWNVSVTQGAGGGTPPPTQFSVTVINGTLNGGAASGNFAPGATVTIAAGNPPTGQWFSQWNGNAPTANGNSSTTTFTMPSANIIETAQFYTPPTLVQPVASHPRLWVTTNDVPRLRSWANANNPVYQQGLKSLLGTAVNAYNKCFPGGQAASPYPDSGDVYGYSGAVISSDMVSEQHALTLAFFALIDGNVTNRVRYAQMARQLLMYEMNEAAKGHLAGAPFRDPIFSIYCRANGSGETWPLLVDWLQGVTDASGQPVTILTAQDKATIRSVFLLWANDCLNAYTTGGDHPSPIGVMNNTALLPKGNAMRIAANNYYSNHARLITLMPLAFDAADDAPLNPAAPDSVLGNTLRSYFLDATGAWLYQQFAVYGDPATVRATFGLAANSSVGLSSGGLPVEGGLYGHSIAYVLGELLALQTAGFNDPNLSGPQISLINAPLWDRYVKGMMSQMVNTPIVVPAVSYLGPIYQMASYGDLLRLYMTPDFSQSFALLALLEQQQGQTTHLNEARWFAKNATTGGAGTFLNRVGSPWTTTESILYFLLFDPTAPAATDPRPNYPTTFYDAPQARVLTRSDWSPNATLFTYRAAPESINHCVGDAGQFELWRKGEWLTKELSNYDNNGNGQSTIWHNTLSLKNWCSGGTPALNIFEVNYFPNGSTWNNGASAGDPSSIHGCGANYDFVQTDMTPLYNRPSFWTPANALQDIQHASRSILHLNNDYVVVYDRAATLHTGLFKRFNLNFITTPLVDHVNNVVTETTPKGQKLFVQSLLPANANINWIPEGGTLTQFAETEPTIGRIAVEDSSNPANVRFLHLLQAGDAGADRKSTRLNSSHHAISRMPSSA